MNILDIMIIWIYSFQFNANLKTLCVQNLVAELGTDFVRVSPWWPFFIDELLMIPFPHQLICRDGKFCVWCEVFALWICPSYFSSCFRGCPVALSQDHFTYRHDLVMHCIVSNLLSLKQFVNRTRRNINRFCWTRQNMNSQLLQYNWNKYFWSLFTIFLS